ncbi:hypothetical protein TIFTF001_011042 [Ficus carica]|uniref:Uncharacterized protein n=1 Tax=Ficus carica TaxID=3494 RepID=A0AA87ZZ73_FICCA|nr:hypothetical protein TIFTF001_011042 [Ficus carica]
MAETPSKRQREETTQFMEEFGESFKRQKSYNDILSLLESEEDEPNEDLSSLITTLQQELSYSGPESQTTPSSTVVEDYAYSSSSSSSFSSCLSPAVLKDQDDQEEEENDKERVMRHLLEASDDELGIPNRAVGFDGDGGFNGGDGFSLPDGLWELEDEAANYYTLLQSELFL